MKTNKQNLMTSQMPSPSVLVWGEPPYTADKIDDATERAADLDLTSGEDVGSWDPTCCSPESVLGAKGWEEWESPVFSH